ncbi:hypothetical protein D9M70_649110 [compost metagenome]
MDKTKTAVQIRTAIPGLQARTQRSQQRRIGAKVLRAELQQVRHDLRRLIHLIVHHHPLQIRCRNRAGLVQRAEAIQGKA